MRRAHRHLALLLLLLPPVARADESAPLTIDAIFKENRFRTEGFHGRWEGDGQHYETTEADPAGGQCIVRYGVGEQSEREVVVPAAWLKPQGAKGPLGIEGFEWSGDRGKLLVFTNSRRVWRLNTRGDYWVLDLKTKRLAKLGGDAPESSLMFAKFSPDGSRVAYVRDRDLYIQKLDDETITRLTTADAPTKINGTFDWVYEEEFALRDGFRFSPDGKRIAFWEIDSSGIELFPLVDNTATLYPKVQWIPYPKVGTTNPAAQIGVIDLEHRSTTWLGIRGNPREHYLPRMQWADAGTIQVQQLNRLQNENRLWLCDAESGAARPGLVEKDAAWVDVHDEAFWLADGSHFTWMSERDGWRHAYLVARGGNLIKPITSGKFDVIELLGLDEKGGWIYYLASPSNPTQKYLYRTKLDGSETKRLTPEGEPGTHQYDLSPDRKLAFETYSAFDRAPVSRLIRLADHSVVRTLKSNEKTQAKLDDPAIPKAEFFRVPIGEGVELDAWCLLPPNLDRTKKYPLIVHVYGEPAGQTVLDVWGGDRALWHRMLAQMGYVVMSFDNRGTPAPRGRDWRKSVYRQIGVLASADQAAAVKSVLASRPYLDKKRVGVWGWSGGGSMTLNALFRYPKLYAAGVSVAPVPNQLYYDTIYQERYMGLPADNAEGYRKGSPITFAKDLEGQLLLVHGTGDDNCHYQTTELLIDELIKHDKPFAMFAYPNRTHAIREGENTTVHLHRMMTEHFKKAIPPGPR